MAGFETSNGTVLTTGSGAFVFSPQGMSIEKLNSLPVAKSSVEQYSVWQDVLRTNPIASADGVVLGSPYYVYSLRNLNVQDSLKAIKVILENTGDSSRFKDTKYLAMIDNLIECMDKNDALITKISSTGVSNAISDFNRKLPDLKKYAQQCQQEYEASLPKSD